MKIGDKLPSFQSTTDENTVFDSTSLNGKYSVFYFYPKDDTPGCTAQACQFRDSFQDFIDNDILVFGISADSPDKHKKFKEKHRLPYTLLSDSNNQLRKLFQVPSSLFGLIPGRVTYVFGPDSKLIYSFNSQLEIQKHISSCLAVIDQDKKREEH